MPYAMVEKEDGGIGGGIRGSHPTATATSRSTSAPTIRRRTLDKAEQLGGKTILPVTELPEVTIALFADPEGHVVGSPRACS